MKKTILTTCFFTSILLLNSSLLHSATSKYRLSLRGNGATTMVIGWSDDDGDVAYGTTDNGTDFNAYPNKRTASQTVDKSAKGMNHHFARLTGLTPDTVYYFVIKSGSHLSPRMSFKTLPTGTGFTMITGGDSRTNRNIRQNGNKLVAKLRPRVIIFCGDYTNADSNSQWDDWLEDWQLTRSSDGRMQPIIAVLGNHEDYVRVTITNIFDTPSDYYSVELGDMLVTALVSADDPDYDWSAQSSWLESELLNHADKTWRVASFHKPMRPHYSSKGNGNDEYISFAQHLYNYKVQLAVDGDTHLSKVTWPIRPKSGGDEGFVRDDENGTVYAGEGSWGAPLRPYDDVKSWTRNGGSFYQFKWLYVQDSTITLRTVKFENVNNVGTVSDNNPYAKPSGIRLFGDDIEVYSGVVVEDTNNAQFISQSIPAYVAPGDNFDALVTYKNTGNTTWDEDSGQHRLGSQNPQGNTDWGQGTNRTKLPSGVSVAPNDNYTFTINCVAPAEEGAYNFQRRMLQEGVEWFGDLSTNHEIVVSNNPPAFAANINFQPSNSITPSGYLADISETYGDRGNGYSYGWNNSFDFTRERNANADKRLDTLNHAQKNGINYTWEVAVPNGEYTVSITGGDASYDDSYIHFVAEAGTVNEIEIASGDAGGVNFVSGSAMVTVSDGRLTITNGSLASNNKICYVDIITVEEPANTAPYFTSTPITDAQEGIAYSYTATADDAEGDVLDLSGVTVPDWLAFNPVSGVLSGVPESVDVGDHPVSLQVTDGELSNGQDFVITVIAAPDPYEEWKVENNVTDDDGDDDNDGIVNLMEFALGGNPKSAGNEALPKATDNGSSIDFKFQRNEGSVIYKVEKSTDLLNWSELTTVSDTHGVVGAEATVPISLSEMSNGKLFLRLKVEK